jgi:RNA polymerase sigma-70 factor (ECF subfamily)
MTDPDPAAGATASAGPADDEFLAALRAGDEAAIARLVTRHHGAMVRAAMTYVRDRDTAEEVVQEAWLAIVRGVDRFEGRSSLATWMYRIVTYQARSRATREPRAIPLSAFEGAAGEPTVEPSRFAPGGHWSDAPRYWGPDASTRLLEREAQEVIAATLEELPPAQRTVITMRDIAGLEAHEVCAALDVSPGNQRVLLHRARARVRAALERYFAAAESV